MESQRNRPPGNRRNPGTEKTTAERRRASGNRRNQENQAETDGSETNWSRKRWNDGSRPDATVGFSRLLLDLARNRRKTVGKSTKRRKSTRNRRFENQRTTKTLERQQRAAADVEKLAESG